VALCACLDQQIGANLMSFYTRIMEGPVADNFQRIFWILKGFIYNIMESL
jgi:hypothetical protein